MSLIDSKEACRRLGISRRTLTLWIRDGSRGVKLRCRFVGNRLRFDPADLDAFTDACTKARLGRQPAPRRKTPAEALETLKRNGYKVAQ